MVADDAALFERNARLQRALPADDRSVQLRPLADVAVAPHDRAVDQCTHVDGHVVAEHRGAHDLDVRADLHAVPEVHRTGDLRGLVDLDVTAGEHAGEELAAERRRRQAALEKIGVRARVLGNGSDVGPVTGRDVPVERLAFGEERRKQIFAEVERLAGFVPLEHARLDHVDAGVDRVREDFAPRWLLEELRDAPVLAGDHDAVLERIRDVVERERDGGLALAMEGDDLREVDVRQGVAGDHDEGVIEGVADLTDGSAGPERRFLDAVLQAHADRAAVAEAVLDL